jgi:hypothetical protein
MFWSEVLIQLTNFREMGCSDKMRILVFNSADRKKEDVHPRWKQLEEWFPEARFFYYQDPGYVQNLTKAIDYIPVIRPWTLAQHFKEYSELEGDAFFYHDSDVLLIKPLDFSPFLRDNINYLSFTGNRSTFYNYIDPTHFEKKMDNILPQKQQEAREEDVVKGLLSLYGLPKERFTQAPWDTIGGAQSLLKEVNVAFFEELFDLTIQTKIHLTDFNLKYMKGTTPEEKGINGVQAWAADMWSLLFLTWKQGRQTFCPPKLDFLWATDSVEKWEGHHYIFHNAGSGEGIFRKRDYTANTHTPFQDNLSYVSPAFCSYHYAAAINKTKKLFNLSDHESFPLTYLCTY